MAIPRDGTLSSSEFYLAASAFSERLRKFNSSLPQWNWVVPHRRPLNSLNQEEGYLAMETVIMPKSDEIRQVKVADDEEVSCAEEDELSDGTVLIQDCCDMERHHYDLHIVYSASYMVPVLFFRAYRSDGQPLLLDDIKGDLSAQSAQLLYESPWMFITQEEHPVLSRPWFTIHPCGTNELMKLLVIRSHEDKIQNYLASWFSVVGQVFGFKLPLQMLGS